ncbi:MAG: hypothetical protein QM518_10180, partial [Verrucomicrobiota bacterium]|nr:hypothetical protein [Verrucomicrobiota bacterium]
LGLFVARRPRQSQKADSLSSLSPLCASAPLREFSPSGAAVPNALFGQALAIAIEIEIDNKRDSAREVRG